MRSVVRPVRQLVGFRHGEKLVERVEPREVKTFATIEKTLLPEVNIEEPEERPKREMLRQQFQFPPATDGAAADPGVASGELAFGRDPRFPVRIAVMFFDKHFDR